MNRGPAAPWGPSRDLTLDTVLAAAREGRPVMLGASWRMRAARYPTDQSNECLLLEAMRDGRWTIVAALQPDGVWASA